jgi:integrase
LIERLQFSGVCVFPGLPVEMLRSDPTVCRKPSLPLPHVQFRDLRHVFATVIAESGGNAYEIQQLLGHADIRVSQRYVNLAAEQLKTAIGRVK